MPVSPPQIASQPLSVPEIHAVLVGILREVVGICTANGIEYCLIGGGCLGLARHDGGFVPWDDDLDIAIWAADMPRFVDAMSALPAHFEVHAKSDGANPLRMVMDKRTRTVDADGGSKDAGVFVDVVPMMLWRSAAWKEMDIALERLRGLGWNRGSWPAMNAIKRLLVLACVPEVAAWLGERHFYRRFLRHDAECRKAGRGVVTAAYRRSWVGRYPYHTVFPLQTAVFCGVAVRVPRDLDDFLRRRYGSDYMQIPPEDARWAHFSGARRIAPE
ncbi:MAG: LicD family protein [Bauldia sp.]|nr:LicD family protein [Bauldia sp.]